MEIKEYLTDVNFNHMNNKNNEYIVIHYVGAVSTAKNNADYFHSVNRNASANYFVDDNDIYRVVKDSDKAWHCGDKGTGEYKNQCTNSNSISIEMCCYDNNGTLDISDTVINKTIELTKELMSKYNISSDRVIRHYDVTHKVCPAPFVNDSSRWDNFKARLNEETIPVQEIEKSINELAEEVIAGKYGVGQDRKNALGDKYNEVQALVNQKLLGTKAPARKTTDELAREVIAGEWGNGADRKARLEAAGYSYSTIQFRVNQLLK